LNSFLTTSNNINRVNPKTFSLQKVTLMKIPFSKSFQFYITLLFIGANTLSSYSQLQNDISPIAVRKQMERVANWQIDHFRDTFSGRDKPHHIAD